MENDHQSHNFMRLCIKTYLKSEFISNIYHFKQTKSSISADKVQIFLKRPLIFLKYPTWSNVYLGNAKAIQDFVTFLENLNITWKI